MFIVLDSNDNIVEYSHSWLTDSIEVAGDSLPYEVGYIPKYIHQTSSIELVKLPNYTSMVSASNKERRPEVVAAITVVTSSGRVFDGDETSQNRMLRAITIAAITGQASTQWKLADNTIVAVELDDLKEALALSGQAMSDIWLAQNNTK